MKYRIERREAFTLCGLSTVMQEGMTPSKFVSQTHKNGKLRKMYEDLGIEVFPEDAPATPNEPKSLYFALFDFRDGKFTYMICHDLPKSGVPVGYVTLFIPALTWAVFSSPEDVGADPAVQCKRAWSQVGDWFSTSEYEHADGPEIEKGYNFGNMNFRYDIWIPVVRKP